MKDNNRMKTKQSLSKSPIKLGRDDRSSGLTKKVAPLNLQGVSIANIGSCNELSKTLTSKRSARKIRDR